MSSCPERSKSVMNGQRVLVTGATGFIGSHLVKRLLESGADVIILIRHNSDLWRIKDVVNDVHVIRSDVAQLDHTKLLRQVSSLDLIYHLAADGVMRKSAEDPISTMATNVMGTVNMLELGRKLDVRRFVHSGSCSEYGSGTLLKEDAELPTPTTAYAGSKAAAHLLVRAFACCYDVPVVSLRPFNVYGPFEAPSRLMPHTIIRALNGLDIELTGGQQKRDFVFISDLVEAFLLASLGDSEAGTVFNVCTGIETSVRAAVSKIISLTNSTSSPKFGELKYHGIENADISGDPSKIGSVFGWKASHSFEEGLLKTITWFDCHRQEYRIYDQGENSNG